MHIQANYATHASGHPLTFLGLQSYPHFTCT